ncbi:flagellar protein [bacterium]|nr:flagellar protein [bacterium]
MAPLYLYSLEITFQAGKEEFSKYTILHVRGKTPFICEPQFDDFNNINKVICAFSKKPDELFKPLNDDFFNVVSELKRNTFFLIITPTYKMKFLPDVFDLTEDTTIFKSDVKLANSWLMVGYKEKFPLLKEDKTPDIGLNIPITFTDNDLLYVGSLDIKGNPVHIKEAKDVTGYLKAKKKYEEKDYKGSLSMMDEIIRSYPESIFMSELIYYKIKSLSELERYDDVVDLSKTYLRTYSSDENVPEVLSLIARAYSKLSLNSDADYFYDRLFSEHADTVFSKKGMIYKGDQLADSGDSKKSLEYYKRALNETKDIDTAATAAEKIAKYYINVSQPKEAQVYVDKILEADPKYFLKDADDAEDLASTLAERKIYLEASKISQIILEKFKKFDDNYELILKDSGIWLAQTDEKADAIKLLNRYIKEFPNGAFLDTVTTTKDSLFFESGDENMTAKLAKYDELMQTYKGDTIAQKALFKKAELLFDNQRYNDVLDMRDSLLKLDQTTYTEIDSMINKAATSLMKDKLKEDKCSDVIDMSTQYNIKLSNEFDEGVFNCYMKVLKFNEAKEIASSHIDAKELSQRMKWMYKYADVDFQIGDYKDTITMGNDLVSLIGKDKKSPYIDIYRVLFDAYQRSGDNNGMLMMMTRVTDIFGDTFEDIERYVQMITLGTSMKDDNVVIMYGEKVMELQRQTSSYTQSPYVEFALYQAYVNQDNTTRAMDVLFSLDNKELTKAQRARQKYLLGALLQKEWRYDEAKAEFKKSIEADKDSAWAKLASDSMKLI